MCLFGELYLLISVAKLFMPPPDDDPPPPPPIAPCRAAIASYTGCRAAARARETSFAFAHAVSCLLAKIGDPDDGCWQMTRKVPGLCAETEIAPNVAGRSGRRCAMGDADTGVMRSDSTSAMHLLKEPRALYSWLRVGSFRSTGASAPPVPCRVWETSSRELLM